MRSSKKIINNPWVYTSGGSVVGILLLRLIDYATGTKILSFIGIAIKVNIPE